jgi:hypothetical protein
MDAGLGTDAVDTKLQKKGKGRGQNSRRRAVEGVYEEN